jgi:hypothetical protein
VEVHRRFNDPGQIVAGNYIQEAFESRTGGGKLTLPAIGALLSLVIFGSHSEHVITLYANAVQ